METFWGADWAQLVRLPFPPAGMDTELLTDTLRSLSREEPPLHKQVGQARGLPPPLQRPTPRHPALRHPLRNPLLPAQPTFLNHGGDCGLCAPPYVLGGMKKGGSLGAPSQVSLPQLLGLAVGRMMTVRSGQVTMGRMVVQAPFSPPGGPPPQDDGSGDVSLACLAWDPGRKAARCWWLHGAGREELSLGLEQVKGNERKIKRTPPHHIDSLGTSEGPVCRDPW